MSEDAAHYGAMDERRAREILGEYIKPHDNSLMNPFEYFGWTPGDKEAVLDGSFTADELEAIAWWMRNTAALEDGK